MRFLRQSLTGLFLMALTLGLFVYAASNVREAVQARLADEPSKPRARERVFTVNVVTATPETISPTLTAFGEVRSRRTLQIRASAAGQIVELAPDFENGSEVKKGDVLARIDPLNAEFALERAENNLRDAQAAARDAQRSVDLNRDTLAASEEQAALQQKAFVRQVDLLERGVGSASAVETAEMVAAGARQSVIAARNTLATAESRVDSTANDVNRARIARDEAQRALDNTTITAEFDGSLADVSAVAGGLVANNEQLARLIDANALEVAFRVSTAQYSRLLDDKGQLLKAPVTVALDVQGIALTADGTITRDSAAVGEGQTGRLVFARLEQTRGLKPGDFVTLSITEPPMERVIALPATALDADETVLVVNSDNRLETIRVKLLRRQGDQVLVRSPDLPGREVVTQRSPLLGAGIKVNPLRSKPGEAVTPVQPELVELSPERREKLKAFISASKRLPEDVKTRILTQLDADRVPAQMVERIEARIGG